MQQLIIQENDSGQRLDRFFAKLFPHIPKSLCYKWIRTKHIKVNRKRCTPDQRLVAGDEVVIFIPDARLMPEASPQPQPAQDFLQAPKTLEILYEDARLLIVGKPVGLVVHCDNRQTPDTLVNRVLHYLYATGAYDPRQEHTFTPALCNRLDRNTGGIVIAAKTAAALREVNRLIRENRIHKTYLCVTVGVPKPAAATLTAWHKKSDTHNTVTIRDNPAPGFQQIITGYRVLKAQGGYALVSVDLITGRTHQIRAHLAHMGTPILGDNKYGDSQINRRTRQKYQLLWAYALSFDPEPDSPLADLAGTRIETPLPAFAALSFPPRT